MDLNKFNVISAANEGAELQLLHFSDSTPLPIFITLYGRDSEAYRATQREHNRKRVAKMQRNQRAAYIALAEVEAEAREIVAACTAAWRDASEDGSPNALTFDGVAYPCNKENAVKVYTDYPWIYEQVDAFLSDRANFTTG